VDCNLANLESKTLDSIRSPSQSVSKIAIRWWPSRLCEDNAVEQQLALYRPPTSKGSSPSSLLPCKLNTELIGNASVVPFRLAAALVPSVTPTDGTHQYSNRQAKHEISRYAPNPRLIGKMERLEQVESLKKLQSR
jgi:hypothetical protein